jgi:mediator of RNA polymerase II transcription subunit 16
MQIATLTSSTILRIKTIETLLSSLTSLIKTAYSTHTPPYPPPARNALEIKMLFGGGFPDAFKSVIYELFRNEGLLDAVREDIEPAKLFFADFTMLEVDEDPISVSRRRKAGMTMDCFRKGWLENPDKKDDGASVHAIVNGGVGIGIGSGSTNGGLMGGGGRQGARWRRCARCAAVMEDVLTNRQALQWLVMQQRRCFCSGYWDTLAPGDTVA